MPEDLLLFEKVLPSVLDDLTVNDLSIFDKFDVFYELTNNISNKNTSVYFKPTITNFSVPSKVYGDASFTIVDPSSNSPGAFRYTSSNTSVATISGNTVTIVGGGNATITATQSASGNYITGTINATLTVNKATTIFGSFIIPTKTFGNRPFQITSPTSSNNSSFIYSSSNTSVATISGSTITIVGTGSSTITASQIETNDYTSGEITSLFKVNQFANEKVIPSVLDDLNDLTVNDLAIFDKFDVFYELTNNISNKNTSVYFKPTITIPVISSKLYGSGTFNIVPSSNSAGAFTYTSSDTSVATISGNTVTIAATGTINTSITITANQTANGDFTLGTASTTFYVNGATPTITNFSVISSKVYGSVPFTINDPSSNSTGAFRYTSSVTSVATISEKTVTVVGVGSTNINVIQDPSGDYASGTTTPVLFVVTPATPSNPLNINVKEELLYAMNTTVTYLNLENNLEINYDLKTSSNKILFANNNNIKITKSNNSGN